MSKLNGFVEVQKKSEGDNKQFQQQMNTQLEAQMKAHQAEIQKLNSEKVALAQAKEHESLLAMQKNQQN
jgi:hypothetical protein